MDHGLGPRKWDIDGNEYIDYRTGHGAMILGQAHPSIVQAVSEQVARGTHLSASTETEMKVGIAGQAARPLRRAATLRQFGHRGDDDDFPHGAQPFRQDQDRQVRERLPRLGRRAVRGCGERQPGGRHSAPGARDDDRAALRHRGRRAHAGRGRRHRGGGVPGQPGHPPVVPGAAPGGHPPKGRDPDLRRGGKRLPVLPRRVPGPLQRDSGPDRHG